MTAPTAKPMSPEKLERELLARLGLDTSASAEDLATAHQAVSGYLAAAPRDLRAWARTQAAAADEAYALLTDPAALARAAALVGASARSAVLPGGPATPPAHRDTPEPAAAAVVPAAAVPAAAAPPVQPAKPRVDENGKRIVSDDEIDALLAEVDPNANPEIVGTPEERARSKQRSKAKPQRLVDVEPEAAPRPGRLASLLGSNAFRNVALVGAVVLGVVIVGIVGGNGTGTSAGIGAANPSQAPAASAPALDQAKVAELMGKVQADPNDADSLMGLGDEFYKVGDYATASDWFTKATKVQPDNIRGFLALGAAAWNQRDAATAETAWKQALAIDDKNVDAHYYLGYLYLNSQEPDMAAVRREWARVVELAPDSDVAKTVQAHLDALASFEPASPAPSGAPVGSPAASPAPSPAASGAPAPSSAPAASPAPSASPQP